MRKCLGWHPRFYCNLYQFDQCSKIDLVKLLCVLYLTSKNSKISNIANILENTYQWTTENMISIQFDIVIPICK